MTELFDPTTLELAGVSLVEASAGTGKTHAITLLVLRLILERELMPSEILVMTFTEAATAELRVRIRRRLQQALAVLRHDGDETEPDLLRVCERHTDAASLERLKRAAAELDEAPITTIHGFCHRTLAEHALRTGTPYGAELVKDLEELDEDVIHDFWHRHVADFPELFEQIPSQPLDALRKLLREVRRHPRARRVPDPLNELMELNRDFVKYAGDELFARKARQRVFGFDDLLTQVAAAVTGPAASALLAELRGRFKAALVDEFQDTDPVQWEIIERVFADGGLPLFLIGDPKQAIYGFRGADVFTYLRAAGRARRTTMRVNWRSDPGLVAAVNQLFCPPNTFVFPEIQHPAIEARPGAEDRFRGPTAAGSAFGTTPDGASVAAGSASLELVLFEREQPASPLPKPTAERTAPRLAAAEIARLLASDARLGERRVGPGDVAVLTRSNKQCFLVQDALRELGINSVVINDKSVWSSEEALDLERVLEGVIDPGHGGARKRALATVLLGRTGDDIDRLDEDPLALERVVEAFQRWQALWAERGFLRMFRQLLRDESAGARLLAQQGGERRLTNFLHLGELLERVSAERRLGPAALLDWLREQRRDDSNRGEHAEIRLESDDAAVRILTIHKSKGLEFPIVYCPFLWATTPVHNDPDEPKLFHDGAEALLDVDTDKGRREPHIDVAKREAVAEEMRVAYVALTRARHRCVVLWGVVNQCGTAAFSFVVHPEPELLQGGKLKITRLAKVSDEDAAAALRGIAEASGGHIGFRTVPLRLGAPRFARGAGDPQALAARQVEVPVRGFERTESFSGLTRHAHALALEERAELDGEGRDHDAEPAVAEALVGARGALALGDVAAAGSEPALDGDRASGDDVRARATPIVLSDFPRGARAGNFFHEILEELDFATATAEDVLELATQKFEHFGYAREFSPTERDRLLGQAVKSVLDVLAAPLGPSGACLADIPRERRFSELEFRVPVAHAGDKLGVTVERLASVFAAHPSAALPASYSERVRRLAFKRLHGFLKGYIDLVFFHAGKWYVVDYKTNHLGEVLGDYDVSRMTREMEASHYFLQYHLYTLAVDRFLGRVEAGYDYERHFGGVLYLFLKGMKPGENGAVFFEKPPASRLQALGAVLDGSAP